VIQSCWIVTDCHVAQTVLQHLQLNVATTSQSTLRAKKAAACLYYISGIEIEQIERAVSQFGGEFDGSAGPIRAVTSRTCDVLPMIGRIAGLLHAGLDLEERIARLVLRLDLGIQGPVVDLARYAERGLDRGDYRQLCAARLVERKTLAAKEDSTLLPLLAGDQQKLATLRQAIERWSRARPSAPPATALPDYQA
jgi:helicase